ncbi:MAG TPA: D-aminoacyl-tRNA deacylase [Polyangiaceae bacterium]
MRAVIQRIARGKVTVDEETTGEIGRGLLVYLGVGKGDTPADRAYVLDKITGLRIFENEAGKFDKSVVDVGGSLLVVSQFTLFADVKKGRRPSFDDAMPPKEAEAEYEAFVTDARAKLGEDRVATGRFRAHMIVAADVDGPVTIWIDSTKSG